MRKKIIKQLLNRAAQLQLLIVVLQNYRNNIEITIPVVLVLVCVGRSSRNNFMSQIMILRQRSSQYRVRLVN